MTAHHKRLYSTIVVVGAIRGDLSINGTADAAWINNELVVFIRQTPLSQQRLKIGRVSYIRISLCYFCFR